MKKRIFSRLMAMLMALALLSTTALAYVEINQDFIDNADVTTENDEELGGIFTYIDLKNDEYKLIGNIETSHTLRFKGDSENPGAEATLDLNGWTIDHSKGDYFVIKVADGAKLTLEDSSGKNENGNYVSAGKGNITGGSDKKTSEHSSISGGGVRVEDSKFVMKGGNITGNTSGVGAGVDVYNNATFIMDGGNIENNNYYPGAFGAGGIRGCNNATITINGGSIQNNQGTPYGPDNASAIFIYGGSNLTINGGVISENSGGLDTLYVYDETSSASINGGKIIDNQGSIRKENGWTFNGGIICGNGDGDHPEHTFSKATCTEDSICTHCGKAGTQKATGHTYNNWVVTTFAQPGVPGMESEICSDCGEVLSTRPILALPMPVDFGDGTGGDTGTTIDDETTPLAGIVTEAQLLDELYKHEGSPAVETVEKYTSHEYAPAISWALANAIVVDDEDFDPDEAVTVALLREVLTGYIAYKGIDFTVTLTGEDDELVLDLSERLTVFFAQLEK